MLLIVVWGHFCVCDEWRTIVLIQVGDKVKHCLFLYHSTQVFDYIKSPWQVSFLKRHLRLRLCKHFPQVVFPHSLSPFSLLRRSFIIITFSKQHFSLIMFEKFAKTCVLPCELLVFVFECANNRNKHTNTSQVRLDWARFMVNTCPMDEIHLMR